MLDLQIRWEDGALKILPSFRDNPEVYNFVTVVLLQAWSFRQFSDSRWLTLGASMRTLLVSVMLGLQAYVDFLLDDVGCSRYYLGGFRRGDSSVLRFAAVAATCSFPTDAAPAACLADDRLPRKLAEIDGSIAEEIDYIFNVSQQVWDWVGKAIGSPGSALRMESLEGSLVSVGYFEMRVRAARRPPFCFSVGDIAGHLDAILDGGQPAEPFTRKIYDLLTIGFPREGLVQMLDLLGNCSHSNVSGEQGHAAASLLKRKHREYESNMLQSRAQLTGN